MKTTEQNIGNEIEGTSLKFSLEIRKVRYTATIEKQRECWTWNVTKHSISTGKWLQSIGLPFGTTKTYHEAQDAVFDALNGLRPEAHRIAREGE